MKKLLLVLLLSGCATVGDQVGGVVDDARDAAEFTLCRGISVGSWMRAYAKDPATFQAWLTLCAKHYSKP